MKKTFGSFSHSTVNAARDEKNRDLPVPKCSSVTDFTSRKFVSRAQLRNQLSIDPSEDCSESKLSICFLCRTFHQNVGGTETYIYNLARSLAAKGHSVHILAEEDNKKYYVGDLGRNIYTHEVNFKAVPFRSSWRIERIFPLYGVRYAWAVNKALEKLVLTHRIDIVEAPDWGGEPFFWILKKTRSPLVIRLHGHPGIKEDLAKQAYKKNLRERIFWLIRKSTIKRADSVVSISNDYSDIVKTFYELTAFSPEVIHLSVDVRKFEANERVKKERIILFVGRLEEAKGIKVLLSVIPGLLARFPDIKFMIAGRDLKRLPSDELWSDYINRNFSGEKVCYVGCLPVDELILLYQRSLFCVFPSLYEPGGTVAYEAMACRTAAIVTRVGGWSETLDDGVTALVVDPDNSDALHAAICRLLQNDNLRLSLEVNGSNLVKSKFGLDEMTVKLLEKYRRVIKKHGQ